MAAETGVPRVGVDDIVAAHGVGHSQAGGQGLDGGVGFSELGIDPVDVNVLLIAGCAHAVHIHMLQFAHVSDELRDVHACSAVDLWWVFLSQHRDPHTFQRSLQRTCGARQGKTFLSQPARQAKSH